MKQILSDFRNASGAMYRQAIEKTPAATISVLFVCVLFTGGFLSARWLGVPMISSAAQKPTEAVKTSVTGHRHSSAPRPDPETILHCNPTNRTQSFGPSPSISPTPPSDGPSSTCPEYFRWIYEDLRPWNATGISRETVEGAKHLANFRLVVLNGSAHVEMYHGAFQTRDVFTLWGILQLLRRYPGRIPDLDLMFECGDRPIVKAREFDGPQAPAPPPLFRYCADDESLDLVFPDWSFWGWPEINIKPWEPLAEELEEGNERLKWRDREPHAYWKGNPDVSPKRQELLKCNVSRKKDWNARLYAQDWVKESRQGFKQSNLASQCIHRYKIYIEGVAWSVSQKYILACNSLTLLVKPRYYDFFTRGLMPMQHYWPIRNNDQCRSIKFAVDWGNRHKTKAQEIGKAASKFIQGEVKMDYVYDYMFHLLNEYSKLLTYKPTIPSHATEYSLESMACHSTGLVRQFMKESMVIDPADSSPCALPPAFDPAAMSLLTRKKQNSIKRVESWEEKAWKG